MGIQHPLYQTTGLTSVVIVQSAEVRRVVRSKITFVNDSANAIYISPTETAVSGQGIRLNANGGSYEASPDIRGYLYQGMWSAIAAGAASNLTVLEETY